MVVIFSAGNCDLGGLAPPFWHHWDHFGTSGGIGAPVRHWEQQEGHVVIRNWSFSGFGMILGPHFESFSGTEGQTFPFVFCTEF